MVWGLEANAKEKANYAWTFSLFVSRLLMQCDQQSLGKPVTVAYIHDGQRIPTARHPALTVIGSIFQL